MPDDLFLGHTVKYWLELQQQVDTLNLKDMIREIAELRSKVSFYESRIKQMEMFRVCREES